MNTYTEILKELQTFRGGEFVPIWSEAMTGKLKLTWHDINEEFLWIDEDGDDEGCSDHNAHAHIELAAILAIYSVGHALVPPQHLSSNPRTSSWAIYRVSVNDLKFVTNLCRDIKDDRATALLAAVRVINGGEARNMKERAE